MAKILTIRIPDYLKDELEEKAKKKNIQLSQYVRDLIQVGLRADDSQDNWDELEQISAIKSLESKLILESILKAVFDESKSKFKSENEELEYITTRIQQVKNRVVHGNNDDI